MTTQAHAARVRMIERVRSRSLILLTQCQKIYDTHTHNSHHDAPHKGANGAHVIGQISNHVNPPGKEQYAPAFP